MPYLGGQPVADVDHRPRQRGHPGHQRHLAAGLGVHAHHLVQAAQAALQQPQAGGRAPQRPADHQQVAGAGAGAQPQAGARHLAHQGHGQRQVLAGGDVPAHHLDPVAQARPA